MLRTSDFAFDPQVVHNFFHSPLVSIAEAVGSPLRRQISLQGTVVKVSNNMYTSTIHLAIQYSSLVAPMLKDHQLKHQLTLTTYVCTTTTPVDHRSLFKCRRTTGVQNYTILNFNIFSISKQMRFVTVHSLAKPVTWKLKNEWKSGCAEQSNAKAVGLSAWNGLWKNAALCQLLRRQHSLYLLSRQFWGWQFSIDTLVLELEQKFIDNDADDADNHLEQIQRLLSVILESLVKIYNILQNMK